MKQKSIYGILVGFILLFLLSCIPIKTNAVFDDKFNVKWTDGQTNPTSVPVENTGESNYGTIIEKYKAAITFISAIAAITMVAVFIINFTKLGTTSGNPQERQRVITALIISGIAAAGLGSISLIVGIFYGLLKS